MRTHIERFPEYQQTDVRYVRVTVRIEHPDWLQSKTYALLEDSRLVDLVKIRRPPDNASELEIRLYIERKEHRGRLVDALSAKIAFALYDSLEEEDK